MPKPSLMTRAVGCLRAYREHFVAGLVCRSAKADWQQRLGDALHRTRRANHARRLAEARLATLQACIEPHFLSNTLATVQYLVRRDAGAADFLLAQLSRYLRHAAHGPEQTVTLHQAFEMADASLQIARMRMGGRLAAKVELPDALRDQPFPPMALQGLVDNALRHGVEPRPGCVTVLVRARKEVMDDDASGRLVIEVVDDGVGLGRTSATAAGAGLTRTRELLLSAFGERASLTVADMPAGGATARVVISEAAQ